MFLGVFSNFYWYAAVPVFSTFIFILLITSWLRPIPQWNITFSSWAKHYNLQMTATPQNPYFGVAVFLLMTSVFTLFTIR